MITARDRTTLARRAADAGLGAVIRVHPPHRLRTGWTVAAVVVILAAGGVAAVVTDWRIPVVVGPVLLLLLAGWQHIGRVGGTGYAVAERGVLVWSDGVADAEALVWRETPRLTVHRVCGRGAVVGSIRRRAALPAWSWRRVTPYAGTVVAAVLVVWFAAVPLAQQVFSGDRPAALTDFARMCRGDAPFGRATPYEGGAPHPAVVFIDDASIGRFAYSGPPAYTSPPSPDPTAVQLVACARPAGLAHTAPIANCPYTGGYHERTFQGRWRIDVYAATTGHRIATFPLDGASDTHCAPEVTTVAGQRSTDITTGPSAAAYAARLSRLTR